MVTSRIFIFFVSMMKAYDLTSVADLGRRDLSVVMQTKRISIVQEAMTRGSHLWIKYLSPTNAEITDRIVTPKDLITEHIPTLFAYCHSAQAERNFRIDRILDLRLVQATSPPPPPPPPPQSDPGCAPSYPFPPSSSPPLSPSLSLPPHQALHNKKKKSGAGAV